MEKNITLERGSNIIIPIILRLLERILSGEEGNYWEENQDFKNGGGEEYQVVRNFTHPYVQDIHAAPPVSGP